MKILLASNDEVFGTSLTAYMDADYSAIVEAFGEPNSRPSWDGKVRFGWDLKVDEIVFTIYDWKSNTPAKKERDWHIGSHGGWANRAENFDVLKKALEEAIQGATVQLA